MIIDALQVDDAAGFAELVAIYRNAIDPSEQKTEAALRAMLKRETQVFLVARDDVGVQGFAILWLPTGADVWSLEYMAVARAHRGGGLGARLFLASIAAARRPFGIIEVEAPTSAAQHRRLAFYARLGCRRLGQIDYLLPLRTNGAPPPMWLLVHGGGVDVSRKRVDSWLARMFVEIYGEEANDPRIAQMLAGEGERIVLSDPLPRP